MAVTLGMQALQHLRDFNQDALQTAIANRHSMTHLLDNCGNAFVLRIDYTAADQSPRLQGPYPPYALRTPQNSRSHYSHATATDALNSWHGEDQSLILQESPPDVFSIPSAIQHEFNNLVHSIRLHTEHIFWRPIPEPPLFHMLSITLTHNYVDGHPIEGKAYGVVLRIEGTPVIVKEDTRYQGWIHHETWALENCSIHEIQVVSPSSPSTAYWDEAYTWALAQNFQPY